MLGVDSHAAFQDCQQLSGFFNSRWQTLSFWRDQFHILDSVVEGQPE